MTMKELHALVSKVCYINTHSKYHMSLDIKHTESFTLGVYKTSSGKFIRRYRNGRREDACLMYMYFDKGKMVKLIEKVYRKVKNGKHSLH